MTDYHDELDDAIFTCQKCKGKFGAIDGTWLPIGEDHPRFGEISQLSETLKVIAWDLRKPEPITDDQFTCYDCL